MVQEGCSRAVSYSSETAINISKTFDVATWRVRGLRGVYFASAVVGLLLGVLIIVSPTLSRKILGFPAILPAVDPVIYGFLGAIWISLGTAWLLASMNPLRYLVLLVLQIGYKSIWLVSVAMPLCCRGEFPKYGLVLLVGNLLWIAMDLVLMPWSMFLQSVRGVTATGNQ